MYRLLFDNIWPIELNHFRKQLGLLSLAVAIALVNVVIVWPLFTTEYLIHLQSNEPSYATISRFLRSEAGTSGWFPYWDLGMPTENTYLPLVPYLTSLVASACKISDISAYHKICGVSYVFAGVGVLFLARQLLSSSSAGFVAAVTWSLFSPSALLFSKIAQDLGSVVLPVRLNGLIYYGDGPHTISVTFLIWTLFLYWKRPWGPVSYLCLILLGLFTFTANAFGAVSLVLTVFATEISLSDKLGLFKSLARASATVIGIAVLALPWSSPLLYLTIARQSQYVGGNYSWTEARLFAWIVVGAFYLASAWLLLRFRNEFRFCILFLLSIGVIPMAHYYWALDLAPQPHRYHVEFELICAVLAGAIVAIAAPRIQTMMVSGAVVVMVVQFPNYYEHARLLIKEVDILNTPQYQTAAWANVRFTAQDRIFVGGDAGYLFNLFSDVLQVSNGHQPSTPNFMQSVGVFTIYSGMNAGDHDLYYSLLWLKAFGARAVVVPSLFEGGSFQPFSNPNKFHGKLGVIGESKQWIAYDTGYRQHSIFRVVREGALVVKPPIHGLDVGQLDPFVKDIEGNQPPIERIQMLGPGHWVLDADLDKSKVISAAFNFDAGWVASVAGRRIETRRDGLGLLVLLPQCASKCQIDLHYDRGSVRYFSQLVGWSAWVLFLLDVGRGLCRQFSAGLRREQPQA